MRIPAIAVAIVGLSYAISLPSAVGAQKAGQWTYTGKYGPINWSKLDPAYGACSGGRQQSPVNIRGARLNPALKPIQFHFIGGPVTLINDGHAIVVRQVPGSFVIIDGVRYDLQYFTFHHPSEHAVNGRLTDMEVDFLTRSADGKMAMLAVLLSENSDFPNAVVSMLWQHLPKTAGTRQKDDDLVDPGGLFPSDPGYWTYAGSLPEPPCTEGVQWYVFETPQPISLRELNAFLNIFKVNTRPLQELHGRRIQANE
jgi:carbonic anhydrase